MNSQDDDDESDAKTSARSSHRHRADDGEDEDNCPDSGADGIEHDCRDRAQALSRKEHNLSNVEEDRDGEDCDVYTGHSTGRGTMLADIGLSAELLVPSNNSRRSPEHVVGVVVIIIVGIIESCQCNCHRSQ